MKKALLLMVLSLAVIPSQARQPGRGYRGFIDWSSSLRSENIGYITAGNSVAVYRESTFYTGFSTSHGYQTGPMFFVGAGFGMERCGKLDNWIAPVFLEGRADFLFGVFTPYADLRIGYNMADGGGLYFSPTVGYRFNWGRKAGINLGIGMTLAGYTAEHYEGSFTGPDSYEIQYTGTRHHMRAYFTFRVGFDF